MSTKLETALRKVTEARLAVTAYEREIEVEVEAIRSKQARAAELREQVAAMAGTLDRIDPGVAR